MAKPRMSKLLAARQSQATGNGNPGNATSKDATEKRPVVAVPNVSQNSTIRSVDFIDETASTPPLGSFAASHSPNSSVSRSKTSSHLKALAQSSLFVPLKKQPVHTSRKIPRLDKNLSSIQIYKLKKQPIGDQEIQPEPLDDAQNFSESEEVEEEQTACENDSDDDSGGATSDLSFVQLESESESDSDPNMRERSNLLNNLRSIPDWDGLSATTTIAQSLAEEDSRVGVFRDALEANSSTFQLEEASLQDFLSVEEHKNSSKYISSESELESSDEADNWQVARPQIEADPIPDITQVVCVSSNINYVEQRPDLLLSQTLQSYLYELVDKVVERTERAKNQLKKRLDKHKLHQQLCALAAEDCAERDKNDNLINLMTGHHLHRLRYSLITQDSSSAANEMNHRHRYQRALNELDSLLKKEQEAERIYHTERDRLQAELAEKQSQDEQEINRVEDLIRETLLPHTQMPERLESVVDTCLRRMRIKRNIISETRLDLIKKQHLNSYIMQKLEEKEDIGEGLTLRAYEASIEEVNKLGRRLTIKAVELQRLYSMFSNKVHTISHLRCRRKLLSRTVREARDKLRQLLEKLSALRAKVHQGHTKHNQLLAQIQEVRYKGGLMNYPLLLMDFDKTDKLVRDKRERVSLLRAHHDSLLGKIEEVELAVQRSVSSSSQED